MPSPLFADFEERRPDMLPADGVILRDELVDLFGRSVDLLLPDPVFDRLARRVFAFQFRHNPVYAEYCRRRGRLPESIGHWAEIPAVPTAAFKELPLVSGDSVSAEAVFRTSGTTRGRERRGEHHILDLTLYHTSLLPNFAAFLLPDAPQLPMLSLMPARAEVADSSLSHMVHVVMERLGGPGSRTFATVAGGVDHPALTGTLHRFQSEGVPVCLLGTSLAFAHWIDRLRIDGERFRLAPGSRLMDTGGFKGRSREVAADVMRAAYAECLGIPDDHCVNEYGMTELCSQFYDNVLRDRVVRGAMRPRFKAAPPWLRTQAVSAETLTPLAPGEVGILRHFDLANLGSVMAVQTEDLGREVEGGFEVLGRMTGAPPRGCSVAMDLLIEAAAEAGH